MIIRPCPFCGNAPEVIRETCMNTDFTLYFIRCTNCNLRIKTDGYSSVDAAIEKWNYRYNEVRNT